MDGFIKQTVSPVVIFFFLFFFFLYIYRHPVSVRSSVRPSIFLEEGFSSIAVRPIHYNLHIKYLQVGEQKSYVPVE